VEIISLVYVFLYLVNTYRQNVTVFIHFIKTPASVIFPYALFIFGTPDKNDESRFHCILMFHGFYWVICSLS
jgi:hypothetical protein